MPCSGIKTRTLEGRAKRSRVLDALRIAARSIRITSVMCRAYNTYYRELFVG